MRNTSTPSNSITTLIEFIEDTGARLRLFDMGRRVVKIPRDIFLQIEKTAIPYPYPLQQQAWLALLFQYETSHADPYIWFLRFPLDEQGKLLQAARDDFMHRLVERLGSKLAASQKGIKMETALQDNPYSFKPTEDRMAVFHARASRLLKQPPSRFYQHARAFFQGRLGWDQWSFIGYQGIADMAARLDQEKNEHILSDALPQLSSKPFAALCHCLENEQLPLSITEKIVKRVDMELEWEQPDIQLIGSGIRGVSCSRSETLRQKLIKAVLQAPCAEDAEILAAISGRAWESLNQESIARSFLEKLAQNSIGQAFFDQCLADLLYLPGMREPLLKALRQPDRSATLSQSVGAFFQHITGQPKNG